jgi:predicted nuclease of predicted toxin-antitoxin system
MNFLVDAQLPRILAVRLSERGYAAQHTLDLAGGNRTPDGCVADMADAQGAVVISKDLDFLNSHLLIGSPAKLLLVTTGNISNRRLLALFEVHLNLIINALSQSNLVEFSLDGLLLRNG